jgi:hypothetical protein
MEDDEQPPAPVVETSPPEKPERRLWDLNRGEQRTLYITFVGGLASIVAGACVIGVAIALARNYKAAHLPVSQLLWLSTTTTFVAAWVLIKPSHFSPLGRYKWIVRALVLALFASGGVYLMALIGFAAGIH